MKKLEFYFIVFGIGIGLFLSGVITNAFPTSIPYLEYTDDEIRERARELGMVGLRESIEDNLEDSGDDNSIGSEEIEKDEIVEEGGDFAEIAINRGEGTITVAQKLYDAEIIEETSEFEDFVTSKGAGNSLREGTYSIEKGSDFENILSIITKDAF